MRLSAIRWPSLSHTATLTLTLSCEDQVEKIIRRYVARAAATKEAIRQLNEPRKLSSTT
jgi:hypothetical protein